MATLADRVGRLERERDDRIAHERRAQHRVKVNGIEYNSTYDACVKLGLVGKNDSSHQRLRADLKAERELIVRHGGKDYLFQIVTRRVRMSDY